jgi:hypothetical protein
MKKDFFFCNYQLFPTPSKTLKQTEDKKYFFSFSALNKKTKMA